MTTQSVAAHTINYKLALICICVMGFCISVAFNYPGFMSYDSVSQYLDAKDNIYSDWHPSVMALIWHFTDKVVPGPLGMLLVEMGILWCGIFLVTLSWFDGDRSLVFCFVVPLFCVFYPPLFSISGAIWKDILMWACLVLAIGVAGTVGALEQARPWRNWAKTGISVAIVFAAILIRTNAVFAAIPMMTLSTARLIGWRTFASNRNDRRPLRKNGGGAHCPPSHDAAPAARYPGQTARLDPAHPLLFRVMIERLDGEELADWRAGRDAICRAARRRGRISRLSKKENPGGGSRGFRGKAIAFGGSHRRGYQTRQ